jgi:hypothetical protein
MARNNEINTGSSKSYHSEALLSTNSPPMKFLVVPPVALVPFQSDESCSALARTDTLRTFKDAVEVKVRRRKGRIRASLCMNEVSHRDVSP